jgi:hypothetical protein
MKQKLVWRSALNRTVLALVKPTDHVQAIEDGIACADWSSFEVFRDTIYEDNRLLGEREVAR